MVVGLVGATLLYGDGTITPAISVLSAIEGLKLYAPQMEPRGRSPDGRHPRGAVPHPAQRHVLARRHFRPRHARLVPHRGRSRSWRDRQVAGGARRAEPRSGRDLSLERRAAGPRRDRRRLPRRDRRRSLLCRHGPFRAAADPRRLVRRRAAGADPELFRPGRRCCSPTRLAGGARQSVLRARAAMGALSAWSRWRRSRP